MLFNLGNLIIVGGLLVGYTSVLNNNLSYKFKIGGKETALAESTQDSISKSIFPAFLSKSLNKIPNFIKRLILILSFYSIYHIIFDYFTYKVYIYIIVCFSFVLLVYILQLLTILYYLVSFDIKDDFNKNKFFKKLPGYIKDTILVNKKSDDISFVTIHYIKLITYNILLLFIILLFIIGLIILLN